MTHMIIYTVKKGDSPSGIARQYGISPEQLIAENGIADPRRLVVGQTLVIGEPLVSYRVRSGDTVYSIARRFGTTPNALYRNNPSLGGLDALVPGTVLTVVPGESVYTTQKESGGYVYTNVSDEVLKKTLPYLTSLTIFTYGIREDGSLIDIEDEHIIELARVYGVAPVMHLSTLNENGGFSSSLAERIFENDEVEEKLLDEVERVMQSRRYEALDVDFEYIDGRYAEDYADFIEALRERLAPLGKKVYVALAPKYSADQEGLLYEGHNYRALGEAADGVILMAYEWGYSRGEPQAVAPIDKVRRVVEYAVSEIPREKILLGTPNYGYDWRLPYVAGQTVAKSLSNVEAVERAFDKSAAIEFDTVAASPYYRYFDREPGGAVEHIVWFEDARSVQATMALLEEFGLSGFTVWNLMRYFPNLWSVANGSFKLKRFYE